MNKITVLALVLPLLSACSYLPKLPDLGNLSLPDFYKDDINQGSVLNPSQIEGLKLGMTKTQVQDLLGSPSVIDPFHNNQWDYINHSVLHKKNNINYRLTLTFTKDVLTHINTSEIASLLSISDKKGKSPENHTTKEKQ